MVLVVVVTVCVCMYIQVHLAASLILNGVCVKFVGWIDMDTLNGKAQLLFDEERAKVSASRKVQEKAFTFSCAHIERR